MHLRHDWTLTNSPLFLFDARTINSKKCIICKNCATYTKPHAPNEISFTITNQHTQKYNSRTFCDACSNYYMKQQTDNYMKDTLTKLSREYRWIQWKQYICKKADGIDATKLEWCHDSNEILKR